MKKYISLTLACIAALIMLQTLYFKFSGQPESVALFRTLGMEPYGRIGTGIAELIAGILLLVPKTRSFGGLLGVGLMTGALASHILIIGIESKNDGGLLFIMALITWICSFVLMLPLAKTILLRLQKGKHAH